MTIFRFLNMFFFFLFFLASDERSSYHSIVPWQDALLYALTTNLGVTLALKDYSIVDSHIRGSGQTVVSISVLRQRDFHIHAMDDTA